VLVSVLVLIASPTAQLAHAEGDQPSPTEQEIAPTAPEADTPPDPSLPIVGLQTFQVAPTGLAGVRPANWQFDSVSSGRGFASTSSLGAPDSFVGVFISREDGEKIAAQYHISAGCACQLVSRLLLEGLKRNVVNGPQPETLEEALNEDGGGTLVVATTTVTPTSRVPVRVRTYARTTIRPDGLIFAHATVPEDQFADEEQLLRDMVDSVGTGDDSKVSGRATEAMSVSAN
jgi:hypothetical protein